MKAQKIIYWTSTIILTLIMLFSASMYLFNHELLVEGFKTLGYPGYLVYPLAIAKILGLLAIWTHKNRTLEEWAYAGFFYNTLLAIFTHVAINDGRYLLAIIAFAAVIFSYATRPHN